MPAITLPDLNNAKLDIDHIASIATSTELTTTDRLGQTKRTLKGQMAAVDAELAIKLDNAQSQINVKVNEAAGHASDSAASALEAYGYLQAYRATSYGALASDPATDPLGNPPTVGDEYFNTTSNLLKRWNGMTWQASDINTANLAASSGSSLIGHDGTTVQLKLRSMQVQTIADLIALPALVLPNNSQVIVKEYHAGTGIGGGNFYWDAASTESADNGLIFSVPGVSTGRFKRLLDGHISTDHYGLIDGYMPSPADTAKTLMSAFTAAANLGIPAVVEANTFVVDAYTGMPLVSGILWIPSNIEIYFRYGSLIKRADYPATQGTLGTQRIINCANRENQYFYGVLSIDGAGDTTTWYLEHNHCFFIYNTKNFYAECINAYNAMGDCLSLSGKGPITGINEYSENITIDRIIAKKARRKCLVIETMKGFTLGHVTLDNTEYGKNCLDYEPLGMLAGDTYPVYGGSIEYLRMFGGFDGTHGTAEDMNEKFPIDIKVMHIELPPGWTTTPFLAFGINLRVGRLIIDASVSGITTETMFRLLYAPKVVIESLQIKVPAAYTGKVFSIQASGGGIPDVSMGDVKISGDGSMILEIQGSLFNCGTLEFQGNATNGSIARIDSASNAAEHRVSIDRVYGTNVKGSYLLAHRTLSTSYYAQLFRAGMISLIDTTGTLHHDAVVQFFTSGNDSLNIGGITAHGFTPVPYVNGAGQVGWHRTAGGVGSLSEFVMFGSTPENVIPAKLGSTARCTNGAIFQKKTGDGLNTGWVELT